MLSLRLKRTGRKGYAQYRLVAQDSRLSPMSGKVAAYLGNYDPHSKTAKLDKEKIEHYLGVGAQPSTRVVSLLSKEGIKLPKWVAKAPKKQKAIRHPEKLRKNRPPEEAKPEATAPIAAVADEESTETEPADTPAEPEQTEEVVAEAEKSTETEPEKVVEADSKPEKPAADEPAKPKAK